MLIANWRSAYMTELESAILQYLNENSQIAHSPHDIHYNLVQRRGAVKANRDEILRELHELENQGLVVQPEPKQGFFKAVTQNESSPGSDRN